MLIHHHEHISASNAQFFCRGDESVCERAESRCCFKQFKMKNSEMAGRRRAHLSPDALVLLRLQKVEQHFQKGRVLAVGLHHIACAGYLLAKGPQRHLVESQRLALQDDTAQPRARLGGFGPLTCLLASDEESCSMSMMMGKSSSIHFLISRPLTWWGGHSRAGCAVSGINQQGRFLSKSGESSLT